MAAVVDAYPDEEAFVDGDGRLTFAEWDRAADGVAAVMADLGVGKGDVVCLLLPSSADYAIAYQAAMRLGAITSGINTRLGPGEVESIFARTEPRLVICESPERLVVAASGPRAAQDRSGVGGQSRPDGPPRRSQGRRPRGGRVDQRHERATERGGLRPRQPGRHGRGGGRSESTGRPPAVAPSFRPRRVHDAGLGRVGACHHHDRGSGAVEGGGSPSPHRRRGRHRGSGGALAVVAHARPSRLRPHRCVLLAVGGHGGRERSPRAGARHAPAARLSGHRPLHQHRGVRVDRQPSR